MEYIWNLLKELGVNGKMLMLFLFLEIPKITNFPGVRTAWETAMHDQTVKSYVELVALVLMAIAAAHRVVKIMKASMVTKVG